MGRATRFHQRLAFGVAISIHALRGEGDPTATCQIRVVEVNFYPRPPWGGRQAERDAWRDSYNISIHALRGEGDTCAAAEFRPPPEISIHALRGEGDG